MATIERKLRFGQVGGGRGSFIGETHRRAATADGLTELVAGAMAGTPERARQSGRDLLLSDERNYGSWQEMLEREAALPKAERINFVSITTPNHAHFEPALAFVEHGIHVVVDKPMVTQRATHIAAGLHEGFFGAFGNIYMNFTDTIRARMEGRPASDLELDFPTVHDGARGVRFMEATLQSSRSTEKWTKLDAWR